jgi:hypothetical protein
LGIDHVNVGWGDAAPLTRTTGLDALAKAAREAAGAFSDFGGDLDAQEKQRRCTGCFGALGGARPLRKNPNNPTSSASSTGTSAVRRKSTADIVTSSLNDLHGLPLTMKRLRKMTTASSDDVGDDSDEVVFF